MKINEVEKPKWQETEEILNKYFSIENNDYFIDNDGTVTVNTNCQIVESSYIHNLRKLPVKFGIVKGTFDISESFLDTLENCPTEIGKNFLCNYNSIKSFINGPRIVKGNVHCINSISVLDGLPDEVHGNFYITYQEDMPLLRLLFIKHLQYIGFSPDEEILEYILKKYIGQGQGGILACAAELNRAGFRNNARR